MSNNGNIAEVTIGLVEKAGHHPSMYGLGLPVITNGLMAKKPGIRTGHYGQ